MNDEDSKGFYLREIGNYIDGCSYCNVQYIIVVFALYVNHWSRHTYIDFNGYDLTYVGIPIQKSHLVRIFFWKSMIIQTSTRGLSPFLGNK